MTTFRVSEEAPRQPLARGTACHRCFARKVRCTGQPDPASGLHACAACLRTARFKGHEIAYCRCAFSGDGLCSEEGGPNVLGEIYPHAGPAARRRLSSRSSSRSSVVSMSSGSQSDGSLAASSTSSSKSSASGKSMPAYASALAAMSEASPVVDDHNLRSVNDATRVKPLTSFELPPPIPLLPFSGGSSYSVAPRAADHTADASSERQTLASWHEIMASSALHGHSGLKSAAGQQQEPPLGQLDAGGAAAAHLPSIVDQVSAPAQSFCHQPPIQAMDMSPKTLLARRARLSPMSIALPPPLAGQSTSPVETAAFALAPAPPRVIETEQTSSLVQPSASFAPSTICLTMPISMALPQTTRQHPQNLTSFYPTWTSERAVPPARSVTAVSSYPPQVVSAPSRDFSRSVPGASWHPTDLRDGDVAYTPYLLHRRPLRLQLDRSPPRPAPLVMPSQESRAYSAALAARTDHLTAAAHGLLPSAPPIHLGSNEASWLVAYAESNANGANAT